MRRVVDLARISGRLESFPAAHAALDGIDGVDGVDGKRRVNGVNCTAERARTIAPGSNRPDWSRTC